MAQYAEDQIKLRKSQVMNSLMSIFMTVAAITYMFILGMFYPPQSVGIWLMLPPCGLLAMAMWFLIKPAKLEI